MCYIGTGFGETGKMNSHKVERVRSWIGTSYDPSVIHPADAAETLMLVYQETGAKYVCG